MKGSGKLAILDRQKIRPHMIKIKTAKYWASDCNKTYQAYQKKWAISIELDFFGSMTDYTAPAVE